MLYTRDDAIAYLTLAGLISQSLIEGRGQCGRANHKAFGFNFLVKDKTEVGKVLKEAGLDETFYSLLGRKDRTSSKYVMFSDPTIIPADKLDEYSTLEIW